MPPAAAAAVTFCFVLLMFLLGAQRKRNASSALWLPVLWFAVAGSRFVSQWLSIWGLGQSGGGETEGSLIDAVYFGILIFSAIGVLAWRQRVVDALVRNNIWLLLFLLYGCLAILWSNFPFVAVKRWILRLGFFIEIVAYNYTEATFKGVSIIWAMFCIVAIAYPQLRKPKQMAVAASEKA